ILVLIPVMMALARADVRLAILASVALWMAAGAGLNLPAELWFSRPSEREWFFNPFAWQLVFFAGFALMSGWVPAPPVRRDLIWLALGIVVLSIPFAWYKIIGISEFIRDWRSAWGFLFDKTDFGILRFVHFLALAYLAWAAAGPGGVHLRREGWAGAIIGLISRVGQQSLAVFATSMVLARVFGAVLSLTDHGPLAAMAVNLAGFAVIIAVAHMPAFFKAKPWNTASPRATASADTPPPLGLRS
ncbi:MAG: OpgC domain-containing protein, partial [Paracoccaceae bacterium]|nr:OpgC domain-containing protein [Paracoccaceae bacterium]